MRDRFGLPTRRLRDQQLAEPLHRLGHHDAQFGAQRDRAPSRIAAEALGEQRQADARRKQAGGLDPGGGHAVEREDADQNDEGDDRRGGWREDAEIEVVEAVDIGADPAEQVAAAMQLQPASAMEAMNQPDRASRPTLARITTTLSAMPAAIQRAYGRQNDSRRSRSFTRQG